MPIIGNDTYSQTISGTSPAAPAGVGAAASFRALDFLKMTHPLP
jgi:hypothetical protein